MELALAVAALALAAAPQAPELPPATSAALDSSALLLAKAGWIDESRRVAEILKDLGYPAAMATKLEAGLTRESSKAKQAADSVPEAAKKLETAAKQIAALLPKFEGDAKAELARKILELDSEVPEARAALGHVKVGSAWGTPEERETLERRLEIDRVRREVAKLEVALETGESQEESLVAVLGGPGVFVRRGHHLVHSALGPERTIRIVREAERALGFSIYLRQGQVKLVPEKAGVASLVVVLFDTREHYLSAVEAAAEAGRIKPDVMQKVQELYAVPDDKGKWFVAPTNDARLSSTLLVWFANLREGVQTPLTAGHLNWVSTSFLGSPIPTYSYDEKVSSGFSRGRTGVAPSGASMREREERSRYAQAGAAGCRTWMAWLAEHLEDPPWEDAFVDQIGKLRGEPLLKATSVAEFLQESGRLGALFKGSAGKTTEPKAVYEAALKTSLSVFEDEWRRWILPKKKGIAQRAAKPRPDVPTAEEKKVLTALNEVRKLAFEGLSIAAEDVGIERSLSDGALLHALYLGQNPEAAAKSVSDEDPAFEGFTPEGAIAAGASVVTSGIGEPEEAVERWMSTFHQRIPLLEPGLLRIGFGWDTDYAVMDVHSLWLPPEGSWAVVWPPDKMKSVPLACGPENPSPVPDVDSTTLGYPITLQVGLPEVGRPPPNVEMKLELDGKEVPCHVSTPYAPTNPEIAPRNAFCLLPKEPLEAGKTYTVTARWLETGKQLIWTFRT